MWRGQRHLDPIEDPSCLRSLTIPISEAASGIMCPVVGPSVPEAYQQTGESPTEVSSDR